jgi:peptidyl-prolyl cis-trans isomerase D
MLDSIRSNTQSWVVKVIFGVIILVFVLWGVGNMGGGPSGSLAQVNGESITAAEFTRVLERAFTAQMRMAPDSLSDEEDFNAFKHEILSEMIDNKMKIQEARRLGIIVTPNELKRYLYSMPQFHDDSGAFNESLYRMQLAAVGINAEQHLQWLEDDLLTRKLQMYVGMSSGISEAEARLEHDFNVELRSADYVLFSLEEHRAKAEVSDEDIAAYYDLNRENFRRPVRANLEYLRLTQESLAKRYLVSDEEAEAHYQENRESFRTPAMFQARLIAVAAPPEGSTEPGADELIAEAKARITEAEARLKAGADFAELAQEYSDDPTSARLGGLLPWYEVLDSDEPLNVALNALETGQVSPVLRNPSGFYIFKMEERRPSAIPPFDEEKERIKNDLAKLRADEDFADVQRMAEDALHQGTSFALLGETLTLEPERTGLVSEGELKQRLGVTKEYADVLSDAIAEAAASGNPFTIPVPLHIGDGIALVRIMDAVPSMIPPLEEIRVELRSAVQIKKGTELALEAAEKALPLFSGQETPEAFQDKVQRSEKTLRLSASLQPLVDVPELVSAVFFSTGGWIPRVFITPQGPVIAKLAEIEPSTPEKWAINNKNDAFVNNFRQWQINRITSAFDYELMRRTKQRVNEQALAAIRWR